MRIRLLLLLILTLFLAGHRLAQEEQQTIQAQTAPVGDTASTQPVIPAIGGAPNGALVDPVLSADSGIVAFASRATNLLPEDTQESRFDLWHIYAYDRSADRLERLSVGPNGQPGNASSGGSPPAISADGRFVAFASRADNLVLGDSNSAADVFVHDRQTNLTTRVSVASTGAQGNRDSFLPAISADGRVVAFVSQATNLVPGDTNNAADVFVHDRESGQTTRVSVASGGGRPTAVRDCLRPRFRATVVLSPLLRRRATWSPMTAMARPMSLSMTARPAKPCGFRSQQTASRPQAHPPRPRCRMTVAMWRFYPLPTICLPPAATDNPTSICMTVRADTPNGYRLPTTARPPTANPTRRACRQTDVSWPLPLPRTTWLKGTPIRPSTCSSTMD